MKTIGRFLYGKDAPFASSLATAHLSSLDHKCDLGTSVGSISEQIPENIADQKSILARKTFTFAAETKLRVSCH